MLRIFFTSVVPKFSWTRYLFDLSDQVCRFIVERALSCLAEPIVHKKSKVTSRKWSLIFLDVFRHSNVVSRIVLLSDFCYLKFTTLSSNPLLNVLCFSVLTRLEFLNKLPSKPFFFLKSSLLLLFAIRVKSWNTYQFHGWNSESISTSNVHRLPIHSSLD